MACRELTMDNGRQILPPELAASRLIRSTTPTKVNGCKKRERLLGKLSLREVVGLEIGSRSSPLVSKAEGPIRYVDYATTEELRASQFGKGLS